MPDAGQTPSVYGSRPVLTVGGQTQTLLSDRLLGLCVEEDIDGLYRAELTIANFDHVNNGYGFVYFDRSVLDFGKAITIQLKCSPSSIPHTRPSLMDALMASSPVFNRCTPPEPARQFNPRPLADTHLQRIQAIGPRSAGMEGPIWKLETRNCCLDLEFPFHAQTRRPGCFHGERHAGEKIRTG